MGFESLFTLVKPTCVSDPLLSICTNSDKITYLPILLLYSIPEADLPVVNFIGCSRVVDKLETSYSKSYAAAPTHNFTASDGTVSGWTKSAGKGAGNVAFVAFANAGHMVSTLFP